MSIKDDLMTGFSPIYTNIKDVTISDYGLLVMCVITIIIYGQILDRFNYESDLLTKKFNKGCRDCDYWGVMHFFFFLGLGILFPGHHIRFMSYGILWEFIEGYAGSVQSGKGLINLFGGWGTKNKNSVAKDWWYGRMGDIVFNVIGYSVGSYLSLKYKL